MKILNRQAVIECKNQQRLNLREAWIQTDKQCLGYGEPVLVIKFHNEPLEASKAMIYLDTLLELIKRANEPKMKDPDKDLTWKLNNLEKQLKEVQRALR